MGLHMHFPKFIKKTFAHKQTQDADDKSTPANSVYSSYASPAPSIVSSAYSRDPMRCGSHPDITSFSRFYKIPDQLKLQFFRRFNALPL
ncbi:hypothetical protein MUCCIDRAFT_115521 [Mucor lusitanicus CBS 277.49]|uniref:Uncharacterized protein n=1 Tax=Mucor lusitanicus CBS 277.49 TaxID=747725 RepID=A0A168HBR2_MUCCL|nr:hypothetical protein MUCCIDRAFT_115521 [Mucor lusitanicus CBS 277.49]